MRLATGGGPSAAGGARILVRRVRARLRCLTPVASVVTVKGPSDRTTRIRVGVQYSVSIGRRTHCCSL